MFLSNVLSVIRYSCSVDVHGQMSPKRTKKTIREVKIRRTTKAFELIVLDRVCVAFSQGEPARAVTVADNNE